MSIHLIDAEFQYILRILNTNVNGRQKILYALTTIKGIGRRFSDMILKKADIDKNKRAGELSREEIEKVVSIIQNPVEYKIPEWFLNRRKDFKDGKSSHAASNQLDTKLREDLERLKRIKAHRGIRHHWNLKVRGQHTKTTSRGRQARMNEGKGKK
eukprot:GHVR01018998.1.p1 GENE.GHVR01018998.1~~GHVR01018998.1.p1  ORF type:complete len:156 (+),score=18.82 GHVR01018998.1:50-517(+)